MARRGENVKRMRDPEDEEAWKMVQGRMEHLQKELDSTKSALKKCQTENRALSEENDGLRQMILEQLVGQGHDLGLEESWSDAE